jgi:predicted DNA-binding transcriptional regulator AlpA
MTTENSERFKGRQFGDLVFLTPRDRCVYIGLSAWQKKKLLRDHLELWKTREDALHDLQARAGVDVEAEPAEPCSLTSADEVRPSGQSDGPLPVPGEHKRLPGKPATNTAPPMTAAAGDGIIIGERRFISERRVAAMLGYSPRQLQRWRKEQKGPPSTKIGRKLFYEINKLQEWTEREKSR